MTKNKTTETDSDVTNFLNNVDNEENRADSFKLVELFKGLTGFEPKMWGPSIVGFGSYHYQYASGHQGDAPLAAFSPRKDALALYFTTEFQNREILLSQLGKHKSSKACVYVKKLSDIDARVLQKMVANSIRYITKLYPSNEVL